MSFLVHFLNALWNHRITLFWPSRVGLTIAASIGVAWVSGHVAIAISREASALPANPARTRRTAWSASTAVVLLILALFLGCYITLLLRGENFTDYDNSTYTLFTLLGHNFPPPIWPAQGRFFPLAHQEFNLIRHFTGTVAGYHFFPIVQLCILCLVILVLDDELSIKARAALTAVVLIIPGIVISFEGLIYPERNVVFWLACLVLCVRRYAQTLSSLWAAAAAFCAEIMIYYKETAFLLLLGFAVGRLILRCWSSEQIRWDFSRLRNKESRLDVCLAVLALIFVLFYVGMMFPHPNLGYAETSRRLAPARIVLGYLGLDLLAWVLAGALLYRVYLIFRHRAEPVLLWDGLALGGTACFAAYLYLRIFSAYYLAPVDFIAVLYLGRLAILSERQWRWQTKFAATVLALTALIQYGLLSATWAYERKNIIHAKDEIARVVIQRYQSDSAGPERLYFPFADPYLIMEFAYYLNFRGVHIESGTAATHGPKNAVLVSSALAQDGPCVSFRTVLCHAGSAPEPGDLVIVLPDDGSSLAEITTCQGRGTLLFSYQPHPRIPQWLYPLDLGW